MHRLIWTFQWAPKASASALTLSTLFALCFYAAFPASSLQISDLLEVALEQSTPIRGSSSSTSSISFLSPLLWWSLESSDWSMHSEAEALEHMKRTDTGHQSVPLENKTWDSTVLKIGDLAKVVIKQDMKGGEHKYGFNNNKRDKP